MDASTDSIAHLDNTPRSEQYEQPHQQRVQQQQYNPYQQQHSQQPYHPAAYFPAPTPSRSPPRVQQAPPRRDKDTMWMSLDSQASGLAQSYQQLMGIAGATVDSRRADYTTIVVRPPSRGPSPREHHGASITAPTPPTVRHIVPRTIPITDSRSASHHYPRPVSAPAPTPQSSPVKDTSRTMHDTSVTHRRRAPSPVQKAPRQHIITVPNVHVLQHHPHSRHQGVLAPTAASAAKRTTISPNSPALAKPHVKMAGKARKVRGRLQL